MRDEMKPISEMTDAEKLAAFRDKLFEAFQIYDQLTLEQREDFARNVQVLSAKGMRERRLQ